MADQKELFVKKLSTEIQLRLFEKFLFSLDTSNLNSNDLQNLSRRLLDIKSLLNIYEGILLELQLISEDQNTDEIMKEREIFQNQYYSCVALAEELLKQFNIRSNVSQGQNQNCTSIGQDANVTASHNNQSSMFMHIKLPTINLPSFDGTYTKWSEFHDAFTSLIENNSNLSNVQKLTYLKSTLSGEAAGLIGSFSTTDANYQIAWRKLVTHYDKKRRIVYNHVQAILDIKAANRESYSSLRELTNVLQTHLQCLKALGQNTDAWDALLVPVITSKLDAQTIKDWEAKLSNEFTNDYIPGIDELLNFLNNKRDALELLSQRKSQLESKGSNSKEKTNVRSLVSSNITCSMCKQNHFISNCEQFLKLSCENKNKQARDLKLCLNCLKDNHFIKNCLSKSACKRCNKRHHTILHFQDSNKTESQTNSNNEIDNSNTDYTEQKQNDSVCNIAIQSTQVLLSTAKVNIFDNQNQMHEIRVLLDSASQSHYITEEVCQRLNLQKLPVQVHVSGISQSRLTITHMVKIKLKSRINEFTLELSCLVIPQITNDLPSNSFDVKLIKIPSNITLADPSFSKSGPIDLLIGASVFYDLLCVGQIKEKNLPIFQKTKFGWVISGCLNNLSCHSNVSTFLSLNDLHKNLNEFWEMNEFSSNERILSVDEQFCENYFKETISRSSDGRFVVKIPFTDKISKLGDSYSLAKERLLQIERRFNKHDNLYNSYSSFMLEYENMKHMSKITKENSTSESFFLPHHPVVKESSETTKLRVVFDGSCSLNSGYNINDAQLAGPSIQNDIFSIVSRFRLYSFVLTGDIAKMYRQIWVHPEHRKFQRILWRTSSSDEIDWYELNTVTYGTKSAPFLAIRCLHEISNEIKQIYPKESKIIREDFYVDDLLTGTNSLQELIELKENIYKILLSYGFELRKWTSNSCEIYHESQEIQIGKDGLQRTLGIFWNSTNDYISYSITLSKENKITKRSILSIAARLYDPMGLIAPTIVFIKFIIKELWKLNLDWDESVPLYIHTKWLKVYSQLKDINSIKIPRHVLLKNSIMVELHTFCDASELGFGACSYLRSKNANGDIMAHLIAGKSRVAPSKMVSLPRLELCSAVLGSRLADKLKNSINIKISKETFWSDSQITLHWIKNDPSKWKMYVANRIVEIQRLTDSKNWNYVKSADNPSDMLTRGVLPKKLKNTTLWWNGPDWLAQEEYTWPQQPEIFNTDDKTEQKKCNILTFAIEILHNDFPIENYSSFYKLRRITSYCLRFIKNCLLPKENREFGVLSTNELFRATAALVKIVQQNHFMNDIHQLKFGKNLNQKSNILSLSPFLDENENLRVGGRLSNSNFNFSKKHPYLLPKDSHLTNIIFRDEHLKLLHANPKLLLSVVRETFWPINGKNIAKKTVKQCVKCCRFTPNILNPIMGALPAERTEIKYPFFNTGVDFAGPFLLKDKLGRGSKIVKGYIALFVCFATKALHLELVSSLSTDAFMSTLKRFIARRGKPQNIFSDNGKNFVGAANELKNLGLFLNENQNNISNAASSEGINWKFIPPHAPNFGGLWEAGVKSTKHHLKRILSNTPLTYEEFSTLLSQIESILNSRPLTQLNSDPNDDEILTPAHFLIGRTFLNVPDSNVHDLPVNRLTRFEHLQQLVRHFWQKWYKEYIHELQIKTKWKINKGSIKQNDIVLLKEDNLPPARWKIGRVTKCYPGKDDVIRVVAVKCGDTSFNRPVTKLCVLPCGEEVDTKFN